MRMIDADILTDEIESLKVSVSGRHATWDEAKADVLQVIDDQKTVDAVEVVRCKDCNAEGEQITHWMPLPEPPEEDV